MINKLHSGQSFNIYNDLEVNLLWLKILINVLNKSTPKYLTDKFEVGADKFNNLKIKLYKV